MKKKAIAAAVAAAFAVPALAQVEVYGSLDVSYNDGSISNTTKAGVKVKQDYSGVNRAVNLATSSGQTLSATTGQATTNGVTETRGALTGSRFGIRAKEDLGGGLTANANIEFDLDPSIGSLRNLGARTSTVGLAGGFGSVSVGRQTTGIHSVVTATSPISGSNMVGDVVYSTGFRIHMAQNNNGAANPNVDPVQFDQGSATAIGSASSAVRANNLVAYTSPVFSGGSVRLDYASDKKGSSTAADIRETSNLGLSFRFVNGPITATAGTHTVEGTTSVAAGTPVKSKFTVNAIGASYDLKVAKINAIYAENKTEDLTATANNSENEVWQLGISIPMGPWTFAGQYGEGDRSQGATYASKNTYSGYQLAAVYTLSKRTNIYAAYGTDEIKNTLGASQGTVPAWGSGASEGAKSERSQMAFGLRHSF